MLKFNCCYQQNLQLNESGFVMFWNQFYQIYKEIYKNEGTTKDVYPCPIIVLNIFQTEVAQ